MKKLILISALFCLGLFANAQVSTVREMTASSYTVTNGATVNLGIKYNGDPVKTVSVQYVGTKVSGTVAGTAKLYGSIDGTNFQLLPNLMFQDTLNSYTNTDVTTNNKIWVVNGSPYLYYRVAVVGSGTMVLIVSALVFPK